MGCMRHLGGLESYDNRNYTFVTQKVMLITNLKIHVQRCITYFQLINPWADSVYKFGCPSHCKCHLPGLGTAWTKDLWSK